MHNNIETSIQQQIAEAYRTETPLRIIGNGTKHFYGNNISATPLVVSQHKGIISYEPTELVITVRAGTPLDEIEKELAKHEQELAFEPPHFSIPQASQTDGVNDSELKRVATIGGTVACGFSGPARANNGSIRDFVLGCEIINGRGEQQKFGGQVMKNVAGYDVSRLICGSLGTLGVILNVSLKVLPKPETETSLSFSLTKEDAFLKLNDWNSKPYPITASCYYDGELTVRLAGNTKAVKATRHKLGGERQEKSNKFWLSIREQTHAFFKTEQPLWRVSVPPNAQVNIDSESHHFTEWHGALHWVATQTPAKILRANIEQHGGHATLFRNSNADADIFHPLAKPLYQIHKNLKNVFDPKDILNRNKMYIFNL